MFELDGNAVLEVIAHDLAKLQATDMAQFSPDQLRDLNTTLFFSGGMQPDVLRWLRARIGTVSGDLTHLVDADKAEFPFDVKIWGAEYLKLVGLFVSRLLIIANTDAPIQLYPCIPLR